MICILVILEYFEVHDTVHVRPSNLNINLGTPEVNPLPAHYKAAPSYLSNNRAETA